MKARIIRGDMEVVYDPDQLSTEMQEICEVREILRNGSMIRRAFFKVGAIHDHPQCWMLVQQGCAEPADDECAARAGRMDRKKLDAAQHAYERLVRGIHMDDFEAYDAGEILGYNPDGSYIKGPNWKEPEELPDELELADEDDE